MANAEQMVEESATRQSVLLLTHRIPYPPNKGDKIRSWRLLKRLASRFDVHLGCFVDDPKDWAYEDDVRSVCKSAYFARLDPKLAKLRSVWGLLTGAPLTLPYYADHGMRRWVQKMRQTPLAAEIAFSSSMAAYLQTPIMTQAAPARPRLVDLCDADSAKWTQYATQKSGPMAWVYGREGRLLQQYEHDIIDWADAAFAISPAEASVMVEGRQSNDKPVHWYGNGVDSVFFDPTAKFKPIENVANIVFVGLMDYWANVDAVQWFMENCWARVRSDCPNAHLAIVGARPTAAIEALAKLEGVTVTGWVDDVRPWLHQSRVVIAPMRIARGVQNKVLEAMAMARPVVATKAAAEGLDLNEGAEILVEDEAQAFATAVVALVKNPMQGDSLGQAARARVRGEYVWARQLDRFDAQLDRLITA